MLPRPAFGNKRLQVHRHGAGDELRDDEDEAARDHPQQAESLELSEVLLDDPKQYPGRRRRRSDHVGHLADDTGARDLVGVETVLSGGLGQDGEHSEEERVVRHEEAHRDRDNRGDDREEPAELVGNDREERVRHRFDHAGAVKRWQHPDEGNTIRTGATYRLHTLRWRLGCADVSAPRCTRRREGARKRRLLVTTDASGDAASRPDKVGLEPSETSR